MLSQKIAALFALMVFASQGVMGRPAPINAGVVGARQGLGDGIKSSRSSLNGVDTGLLGTTPGDRTGEGLLGTGIGAPQGLGGTELLGESLLSGTPGGVV